MKQIASLFLIVTLFYNVLGYYLMFAQQEEQAWVASMEKNEASEFKVIHLNASLYSFIEDRDFEYVNENVTIHNKTYHVFKKRIQNNILSLYYLPNLHQEAIGKDIKDIVENQLFNGSSSKESPVKKLMKSFLQDYIPNHTVCVDFYPETDMLSIEPIITPNQALNSGHVALSYSPPDIA
jgi:hypothetical protein